jgi:hypothetical protein
MVDAARPSSGEIEAPEPREGAAGVRGGRADLVPLGLKTRQSETERLQLLEKAFQIGPSGCVSLAYALAGGYDRSRLQSVSALGRVFSPAPRSHQPTPTNPAVNSISPSVRFADPFVPSAGTAVGGVNRPTTSASVSVSRNASSATARIGRRKGQRTYRIFSSQHGGGPLSGHRARRHGCHLPTFSTRRALLDPPRSAARCHPALSPACRHSEAD